jgi:predicted lipid-binding transport protein (Tim44 family)
MIRPVVLCFLAASLSAPALAQEQIIYPAQGQSNEQMEQDRFQCYTWGRDNSGFDPMAPPTATKPPPRQEEGGGALQGAAMGGAVGGAIGGIAKGSKKGLFRGAAAGAAAGGLLGGVKSNKRQNKNAQRQQDWERQQAAQYSQGRNAYNRAFGACMTGRGYTVG